MDVSRILPNLFVGPAPKSSRDIIYLKQDCEISAILNVQTDEDIAHWGLTRDSLESYYQKVGIEFQRVPVQDFDPEDLQRKLPQCVEVLDHLLHQGHKVYVHCSMGINRSPTVVIAYLHWIQGWRLEDAFAHVTKCRSCDPCIEAIRGASVNRK
jgi:protein-tyrosine phosphatase